MHRQARDVSYGGLAFSSDTVLEPESFIALRITFVQPAFETTARVAWCRPECDAFVIGVQFLESRQAFQVRMVEQICHIEKYRQDVALQEGRRLTGDEAVYEWARQHAASFPNP
jgi:hypothetical protein